MMHLSTTIRDLNSYLDIQPCEYVKPPKSRHVHLACEIVNRLHYLKFRPMLNSDGTVGLYYDAQSFYVDIEIEHMEEITYFERNKITKSEFYTGHYDLVHFINTINQRFKRP